MGQQIAAFYRELNNRPKFSGKTTFMGVAAYEAAGVQGTEEYYRQVMEVAGSTLVTTLVELQRRCPQSKFVLVGYSQGAYAVRDAITFMENNPSRYGGITSKIAAGVAIADPGNSRHGILYLVRDYARGLFPTLADILNTVQAVTGIRLPYLGEIVAVSSLAQRLEIAGTPTSVPFRAFDNSADIVPRGKQLVERFAPRWVRTLAAALLKTGAARERAVQKAVRGIESRLRTWGKFHTTSYDDGNGVIILMADWTVMKSR